MRAISDSDLDSDSDDEADLTRELLGSDEKSESEDVSYKSDLDSQSNSDSESDIDDEDSDSDSDGDDDSPGSGAPNSGNPDNGDSMDSNSDDSESNASTATLQHEVPEVPGHDNLEGVEEIEEDEDLEHGGPDGQSHDWLDENDSELDEYSCEFRDGHGDVQKDEASLSQFDEEQDIDWESDVAVCGVESRSDLGKEQPGASAVANDSSVVPLFSPRTEKSQLMDHWEVKLRYADTHLGVQMEVPMNQMPGVITAHSDSSMSSADHSSSATATSSSGGAQEMQ